MSFLTESTAGVIGGLANGIAGIIDRFVQTKDEKAEVMLELEKMAKEAASELEETMRAELGAKERVLIAELQQGDSYTKRARPTVVYFGLAVIGLNFAVFPIVAWVMLTMSGSEAALPELMLPAEFWYAWGGIVATWSVGRSMERRGASNNLVSMITGNKAVEKTMLERLR